MFAIASVANPLMLYIDGGHWINRNNRGAKSKAKTFKTRRGAERYLSVWFGPAVEIVGID